MANPEGDILPYKGELRLDQIEPSYRSPFMISSKTFDVLRLINITPKLDLEPARKYLQQFTFGCYLNPAISGCDQIFDKDGVYSGTVNPETRFPAAHAYTVFSWLADMTVAPHIKALSDGFSRRGMLRAPSNKDEYVYRVNELKIELAKAANGIVNVSKTPESELHRFRTFVFFRVADHLTATVKLLPGEAELRERQEFERERLNRLLGDINLDLP